jgi:hypothetical protein
MATPYEELMQQPDALPVVPTPMERRVRVEQRHLAKVKVEDLERRGIAHYTTPQGEPKEITDWTGAALTNFDPKSKVAYDAQGFPQKIGVDTATGAPTLSDPYKDAPRKTDKQGNIYAAPKGLPYQHVGEDPVVKAAAREKQTTALDQEALSAIAPVFAESKAALLGSHKAAKASAKLTAEQLEALGVPLVDDKGLPKFDLLNADAPALRAHIEESTNREYGDPAANAKPLFGGGNYTPAAEALRKSIGERKKTALETINAHAATVEAAKASKQRFSEISAQRQGLQRGRVQTVNARREAAGLWPVTIPGLEQPAEQGPATPYEHPTNLVGAASAQSETAAGPQVPVIEAAPVNLSPVDRSFKSAFLQGIDQPLEAIGTTAEVFGADTVGGFIRGATNAPENYESASQRFMQPQEGDFTVGGFAPAQIPRAIVEQFGQVAGSMISRVAGAGIGFLLGGGSGATAASVVPVAGTAAGGVVGGLTGATIGAYVGPFLFGALQIAGPTALERARLNGRTDPNGEDIAAALVTASASGALDSIGAQFLPGGKLAVGNLVKKIGTAFMKEGGEKATKEAVKAGAAKRIGVAMAGEGVTEGAQSIVEQTGETAGTVPGLNVSLKQAAGEGVLGALTGGVATGAQIALTPTSQTPTQATGSTPPAAQPPAPQVTAPSSFAPRDAAAIPTNGQAETPAPGAATGEAAIPVESAPTDTGSVQDTAGAVAGALPSRDSLLAERDALTARLAIEPETQMEAQLRKVEAGRLAEVEAILAEEDNPPTATLAVPPSPSGKLPSPQALLEESPSVESREQASSSADPASQRPLVQGPRIVSTAGGELHPASAQEALPTRTGQPEGATLSTPASQPEPQSVSESTAVDQQPSEVPGNASEQPASQRPLAQGPRIVSTAVRAGGEVHTGPEWKATHGSIIVEGSRTGLDLTEGERGFIVEEPDGTRRFTADRAEAGAIATAARQVPQPVAKLQSEHLETQNATGASISQAQETLQLPRASKERAFKDLEALRLGDDLFDENGTKIGVTQYIHPTKHTVHVDGGVGYISVVDTWNDFLRKRQWYPSQVQKTQPEPTAGTTPANPASAQEAVTSQRQSALPAASSEAPKSSTQVTLAAPEAEPIRAFARSIPDADVYKPETEGQPDGYGRETEPHVTALYGLTDNAPEAVQRVIREANTGPVTLTLGKLSLFKNADSPYDVLKVDVESPQLRKLNTALKKLPNKNTFPDYTPHLTVAYVKKGAGDKYAGDSRFAGQTITIPELTFISADRQNTAIPLSNAPQTADTAPANEPADPIQPRNAAEEERQGDGGVDRAPEESAARPGDTGVDGQGQREPAQPYSLTDASGRLRKLARGPLKREFARLGTELHEAGGDAAVFTTLLDGERITFNAAKVAQGMEDVRANGLDPEAWLRAALDEELIHARQLTYHGNNFTRHYAELWRSQPKPIRDLVAKVYDVKGMPPQAYGAEMERMIAQVRETGTFSEELSGKAGAAELKTYLEAPQSDALEDSIARVESLTALPESAAVTIPGLERGEYGSKPNAEHILRKIQPEQGNSKASAVTKAKAKAAFKGLLAAQPEGPMKKGRPGSNTGPEGIDSQTGPQSFDRGISASASVPASDPISSSMGPQVLTRGESKANNAASEVGIDSGEKLTQEDRERQREISERRRVLDRSGPTTEEDVMSAEKAARELQRLESELAERIRARAAARAGIEQYFSEVEANPPRDLIVRSGRLVRLLDDYQANGGPIDFEARIEELTKKTLEAYRAEVAQEYVRDEAAAPERARQDRLAAKQRVMGRERAAKQSEYSALWSDLMDAKYGDATSQLARFWKAASKDDEMFLYPTSTSREADTIARQMSLPGHEMTAGIDADGDVTFKTANGELSIQNPDGSKPTIYAASAGSAGKKGGGGAQLYQAALAWAHNNGVKIHPSNALTPINKFVRRTSNMLSSALRFGATKHMIPDADQGVKWKAGKDGYNIAQLAMREMQQVFKALPALEHVAYDFATGNMRNADGAEFSPAALEAYLRAERESSFDRGIGRSTAQRAIITASALREFERGEGGAGGGSLTGRGPRISETQGPILYASQPSIKQSPLPKDRRAAFMDLADALEADGVKTPEDLAAFLDDVEPGRLRRYAQALLDIMGATGAVDRGEHQWDAIFAAPATETDAVGGKSVDAIKNAGPDTKAIVPSTAASTDTPAEATGLQASQPKRLDGEPARRVRALKLIATKRALRPEEQAELDGLEGGSQDSAMPKDNRAAQDSAGQPSPSGPSAKVLELASAIRGIMDEPDDTPMLRIWKQGQRISREAESEGFQLFYDTGPMRSLFDIKNTIGLDIELPSDQQEIAAWLDGARSTDSSWDSPQWDIGYRYSAPPESGRSFDFRDQFRLPGVSIVALGLKPKESVDSFYDDNRQKYLVAGWNFDAKGSDGEPLLHEVKSIKFDDWDELDSAWSVINKGDTVLLARIEAAEEGLHASQPSPHYAAEEARAVFTVEQNVTDPLSGRNWAYGVRDPAGNLTGFSNSNPANAMRNSRKHWNELQSALSAPERQMQAIERAVSHIPDVLRENGRPMLLHRGTYGEKGNQVFTDGIHFSTDESYARQYAEDPRRREEPHLVSAVVRASHPLDLRTTEGLSAARQLGIGIQQGEEMAEFEARDYQAIRQAGFDAILFPEGGTTVVAFRPEQVIPLDSLLNNNPGASDGSGIAGFKAKAVAHHFNSVDSTRSAANVNSQAPAPSASTQPEQRAQSHQAEAQRANALYSELILLPTSERSKLDTPAAPVAQVADIERAYAALVKETGFPAVKIADLMERVGFAPGGDPMQRAKGILVALHRNGRAVFGGGDWSLSTPRERAWSVINKGDTVLLVRIEAAEEGLNASQPSQNAPTVAPANTEPELSEVIHAQVEQGFRGWRRIFDGTADVLDRATGRDAGKLHKLAKAIRKHVDRTREIIGAVSVPYRELKHAESRKAFTDAEAEVETYYRMKDRPPGTTAPGTIPNLTADMFEQTMSAAGKEHLKVWRGVATRFADFTEKLGMQVQGQSGRWRPIGRVKDYHPRSIRPDYLNAIRNPRENRKAWAEVVKVMLDAKTMITEKDATGKEVTREAKNATDIQQLFATKFREISSNDFFSNIEKARELQLPNKLYDYSFRARQRYIMSAAERVAQVEAYGQKTTKESVDAFDRFLETEIDGQPNPDFLNDAPTREYVAAVRDRAYGKTPRSFGYRVLAGLNAIATGTQLGNPISVATNLFSGLGYNVTTFGVRNSVEALGELKNLGRVIDEAHAKGVLLDDLMSMYHDADQYGSNVVTKLQDTTGAVLKLTGYNSAEVFVRAMGYVTARNFLRHALAANTKDRNSHAARSATAYFKRNGIDPEKLYAENGAGRETDRFYRASVNTSQGGYRFDQVPVYQDTAIGKFLFKYQKWGAQATRNFIKNAVEPALGINGPVDVAPILRYMVVTALVGGGLAAFKELLFGTPDKTADFEQIGKTWTEDERRAIALGAQKLWMYQLAAGAAGMLGTYSQIMLDFTERSKFKSPLEPPGLSSVINAGEQAMRLFEQKQLTAKDADDYLRAQLSLYRTGVGAAGKAGLIGREKARQDNSWLGIQTRRFASEIGVEASRTSQGRIGKTESSPAKRDLLDALRIGDVPAAKKAVADYTGSLPPERRGDALKSLAASVRSSQPIRVGVAGESRRVLFMDWASRRLPAEDVARVRAIDRTYRETAEKIGLFDPKLVTPKRLEATAAKLGVARPSVFSYD